MKLMNIIYIQKVGKFPINSVKLNTGEDALDFNCYYTKFKNKDTIQDCGDTDLRASINMS